VRVTTALAADEAVVRVFDRVSRRPGAEGRSDLHALENEIDAETIVPFHAPQGGPNVILLADPLFRPLVGKLMVAGESVYLTVILDGPLAYDSLGDGPGVMGVAEQVVDVLGPGQ